MSGPQGAGSPAAPLHVFLVAGETSGDELGGRLMASLREARPDVIFSGVGGHTMMAQGLSPLFPMAEISVMGFLPVLQNLPSLLRRIRQTADSVITAMPDVLVLIDAPDFTHRVARRVRARAPQIPIVDYVSPTVWAWRPGRARKMRFYIDHVLALLPFEPEAHRRLGGPPCTYVGHPLIERLDVLRAGPGEAVLAAEEPPLLVVLPGSRRSEVSRLMGVFGEAVGIIANRVGALDVVLPAVPHLEAMIRQAASAWPVRPRIVLGESEKFAAFRHARSALAASGTVTLELALAQVPMAVAYKVSATEAFLARRLVTAQSIVLPNLIVGGNFIPEFLQEACEARPLADAILAVMSNGGERERQMAGFAQLGESMAIAGAAAPSALAAGIVMELAANKKGA